MSPAAGHGEIIRLLLERGELQEKDLRYAERVHAKIGAAQPLLNVLKELKLVTDEAVRATLHAAHLSLRIGDLLVELGHIHADDLEAAFNIQQEREKDLKLGEILIKYNFIEEKLFYNVLSIQLGFPLVNPDLAMVDRELLARIPPKILETHVFLPISDGGDTMIAFADTTDKAAIQAARRIFGQDIRPAVASKRALVDIIRLLTNEKSGRAVNVDSTTVVGLVNSIILAAIKEGASDIHIEPMRDRLHIRFREDGILQPYKDFPKDIIPPLTSRIKIMCKADIAERRRHQGGRILFDCDEGEIDIRVSLYVTIHGEKIVLRLLRQKDELLDIQGIGLSSRMLTRFLDEAVYQPSGVLMVTGPTGSGKTSTIYSCIKHIKSPQISIITAEEPVEFVIDGVAQCSIDPNIDLTFQETLRHIVRQDPDVIVIGEIRDTYSAEMAVQAALTGHKVLTTFHTEDSIGGLIRLLNMDIAPFLVSSTVVSVLAQRLLRRICPHCAAPTKISANQLQRLGYTGISQLDSQFLKGRGCAACKQTGYKGRIGVFELLVLDELVRDAILARRTSYEIRNIGIEHSGLMTLLEDGLVKAAAGLTTIDEILRCLPKLRPPRPLAELRRLSGDIA
jgi:type IV pilus assembly protein PilB